MVEDGEGERAAAVAGAGAGTEAEVAAGGIFLRGMMRVGQALAIDGVLARLDGERHLPCPCVQKREQYSAIGGVAGLCLA